MVYDHHIHSMTDHQLFKARTTQYNELWCLDSPLGSWAAADMRTLINLTRSCIVTVGAFISSYTRHHVGMGVFLMQTSATKSMTDDSFGVPCLISVLSSPGPISTISCWLLSWAPWLLLAIWPERTATRTVTARHSMHARWTTSCVITVYQHILDNITYIYGGAD